MENYKGIEIPDDNELVLDTSDSIELLKAEVKRITEQLKILNQRKIDISKQIKEQIVANRSNRYIEVTDHCIVRYFERKLGYNIDEIIDKIAGENIVKIYDFFDQTGKKTHMIQIDNDITGVYKNKHAITILKNNGGE